jgi:hypothetical protein
MGVVDKIVTTNNWIPPIWGEKGVKLKNIYFKKSK